MKPKIGLVGLWFERGNAHLTYGLREMLLPSYDVYTYARTGIIVSAQGRVPHMATTGQWDIPNITRLDSYDIDPTHCADWIRTHDLQAVIWNEEYNHQLIRRVRTILKDHPCQQLAYLDWVGQPAWVQELPQTYHHLLCATERTRKMMETHGIVSHRFQWGVDLDLFKPGTSRTHMFFHNAGWGGTNFRKGSIALLNAWVKAFGSSGTSPTLLFHTQKPVQEYPGGCRRVLTTDSRISVVEGTVPAPGLYHRARVYVGPSKLEGLGLTFSEALACGMYLVTTDAAPMNEHGDSTCAEYIPIIKTTLRGDGCAFPEMDVDVGYLAKRLTAIAQMPEHEVLMKNARARVFAAKHFDRKVNGQLFASLLGRLLHQAHP